MFIQVLVLKLVMKEKAKKVQRKRIAKKCNGYHIEYNDFVALRGRI